MGNEDDFTPEQLAADIRAAVIAQGVPRPFVLCGHSMGGMVVMRYAAKYPADLHALVIEDMDLRPRSFSELDPAELARYRSFSRQFATVRECKAALETFGYAKARVEGWVQSGRIYPIPGGIWTNINPMARHLACNRVLSQRDARSAFESLRKESFPVHLYIAGKGSVCKEEGSGGVEEMRRILPRLKVSRFPSGYHSIHNTARPQFLTEIKAVVDTAANTKAVTGTSSKLA